VNDEGPESGDGVRRAADGGAGGDGRRVPRPEVPGGAAGTPAPGAAGRPQVPAPELPARSGGADRQAADVRVEHGPPPAAAWPAAPPALEPAAAPPSAPPLPPTRAAAPGQPFYLPRASWRWPAALAGLAMGSAPEVILSITAAVSGEAGSSRTEVTAASAALLAVSALIVYGWQGLAAWLFSLRAAGRSLALWGFRRPNRAFFWTIPLALVATYTVTVVHDLIVSPEQQQIVREFPRTGAGIVLFVVVAVVMAPLFEEIVFRGFLFRGFANSWGWVWGAVVSAGVFGIAHLQLDVFIPLAVLGFALAWVYRRTGSLWTCIAMHAIFNAVAVLAWALTG
jgi:membrane protease YdiL (CAAX protease family)